MDITSTHLRAVGWGLATAALAAASATAVSPVASSGTPAPTTSSATGAAPGPGSDGVRRELRALERERGARLGVFAVDTGSGRTVAYRADERFAMASTVKVPVAATVLENLSTLELERRVFWTEEDLVAYSPVTETFIADGMTVRQLVDAALTQSDNTAANLLFEIAGGPAAVDRRLARLGDDVTSVDRVEPELNDWRPGETRDTSTPRALAGTLGRLTLGGVLDEEDEWILNDELGDSLTGAGLVRAGVPEGWPVGDKSGTASYGTRNDVAVVRPPGEAPWLVVVMTSHAEADAETDNELVARASAIVTEALTADAPAR
ncbi:class A beta-lactamase [Phycicoccus sp. CSK15P-2]|uniref:class A beta-lactamase n=1 Tax=Phycicoccus sp. CSK15P-2 TaxID=2807627 RepID=UPI001952009F|nr:class A beta-lactamase [Phycicoccus sp. CSK15P-2]MBM6403087.1 class A beta-lactamase [Phycicoccus sp. CSK15P-2]